MRIFYRAGCAAALTLPLMLAGCSLFPTTRHLPVPKAPPNVQTVSAGDLVKQIDQRWDGLKNLTVVAELQATEYKAAEGLEKQEPSVHGAIVMQKPKMLRVVGQVLGVRIFDMSSDGSKFTLYMPTQKLAKEGSNTVTEKSPNPLENIRPDFFLDALMVRGLEADDDYMMTNDTETVEDPAKKHLYTMPEYVLNVMRAKAGREKQAIRVITFHRDDMQAYDQDVYDSSGNLETQIFYSNYAKFDAGQFPSKITIKRPQEGIQIVLSVDRVQENVDLPADEFEVTIPQGTKIEQVK